MFDLGEYGAMPETVDEVEQRYSTSQQAAGDSGGTLCSHQHLFLLGKIRAQAENKCAFSGGKCDSYSWYLTDGKIPRQAGRNRLPFLYQRARRAESQRLAPVSVSCTLGTDRNSSVTHGFVLRSENNRSVLCWCGCAWPAGREERGKE